MNERIKELWDQAALLESDPSWEGQTKFMDKFAELIVLECASVNYNSPFQDGEFHAREVLEHFGVEE